MLRSRLYVFFVVRLYLFYSVNVREILLLTFLLLLFRRPAAATLNEARQAETQHKAHRSSGEANLNEQSLGQEPRLALGK